MIEITLDWKKINSYEEFYDSLLSQLEAPDWHGRNMNALADSIVTGSINKIEPPYRVLSLNESEENSALCGIVDTVITILEEAIKSGREIELQRV